MSDLSTLEASLDRTRLPRHVGIIMDGNGRWAEARGMPRVAGHREGSAAVRSVTRCARRLGIEALTLYAFSSQNWSRPAEEVAALMGLLREYLLSTRDEVLENDIRLQAIGDIDSLPAFVRAPLDEVRAASTCNRGMTLNLALSYGGREEILRACRDALREGVPPDALDAARFESLLFTAGLPELDLIIRTSGEQRLSNFMLWQAAYAEFVFVDTLWPDFKEEAFVEALLAYQVRSRRFGLVAAQAPHTPRTP